MRLPVRVRLTLWYTSVMLVILAGVGVFVVSRLNRSLVGSLDESLGARAQVIGDGLASSSGQPIDRLVLPSTGVPDVIAQVVAVDGRVVQAAGEGVPRSALIGRADIRRAIRKPLYRTLEASREQTQYRVIAVSLRSGSNAPRALVVGRELENVHRTVRGLIVLLLLAAPAAAALAAGGGWVLARAALRPVDVMTRTAAAIDARGQHDPIPVSAPDDELARLARTLNDMLDRLHGALEEERRFSADASHELRTPLGIMIAELDVALRSRSTPDGIRPSLESVREEVARLTRIVENLFVLARLDEADAFEIDRHTVDLLDLGRDVVDRFRPTAVARDIRLRVDGTPVNVDADTDSLSQVIANIVENALDYTERGGDVHVSIAGVNGEAIVTVADTGIGVPPGDLAHIFDRFYRVDRARSRKTGGAGLGLAIVRRLVEAHGGRVTATSEQGRGSSFVVKLPLARQ